MKEWFTPIAPITPTSTTEDIQRVLKISGFGPFSKLVDNMDGATLLQKSSSELLGLGQQHGLQDMGATVHKAIHGLLLHHT